MKIEIANVPRKIFKSHPIFGWTLTPNKQVKVGFRQSVVQNMDDSGNRYTPRPKIDPPGKKLTFYGCSFTYGTGLKDTETFVALIQAELPDLLVTNKGVGGHSSVQALLRFRADIIAGNVDAAVFGVISDHRYRNFPHPYRMKAHLSEDWYKLGVEQVPHARLNREGGVDIVFTPIRQPGLLHGDIEVFLPDENVLDLITLAVFREIQKLANEHNVPVIFALLDQLDPCFNTLVTRSFSEAFDVSTPYSPDFTFQPHDLHPNAVANQYFSKQLLPAINKTLVEPRPG